VEAVDPASVPPIVEAVDPASVPPLSGCGVLGDAQRLVAASWAMRSDFPHKIKVSLRLKTLWDGCLMFCFW